VTPADPPPPASSPVQPPPLRRRPHLDWLRGIGVLIMIEGHALDAWTRTDDRDHEGYRLAILVAGIGAPLFLFLAGAAMPLAARSRLGKGWSPAAVWRMLLRHGAWVFALAFLFRLQSWIISGGVFPWSLLKVDILNVMGIAMMAAALLWACGPGDRLRMALFAAAAAAVAMVTPLVRASEFLALLPDTLEAYLRPAPGSGTFTLFPWAGFLMAGVVVGIPLAGAASPERERRVNVVLLLGGVAAAAAGYGASYLPPIYESASFWTSSPTFFFIRLGIVIALVPMADVIVRAWPGHALQLFGRASLFVYWIHVEMAYGVLSTPLHRRLPFPAAVVALVLFGLLLYALVRLKERLVGKGRSPKERNPGGSPIRPAASPAS
jgi:uncharacterized membrane protein